MKHDALDHLETLTEDVWIDKQPDRWKGQRAKRVILAAITDFYVL